MAFDFVDMLVPARDEYLTGYFYKRRPRTPEDGRVAFSYKQLDPNAKRFDKVLGNVRADSARYAISTNDDCGFNVGGYIVTQNGLIWEITDVITNEQAEGSNNALRWFTTAKNSETSVRMIQVSDLFDKEETYEKYCNIEITVKTNPVSPDCVIIIDDSETLTAKHYSDSFFIRKATAYIEKGKGAKIKVVVGKIEPNSAIEEARSKTFYVSSLQTTGEKYFIEYDSTLG